MKNRGKSARKIPKKRFYICAADKMVPILVPRPMGPSVTSAGWQVTLCDPMWHMSSRSGVATLLTAIHLLLTYLLTFIPAHIYALNSRVATVFFYNSA